MASEQFWKEYNKRLQELRDKGRSISSSNVVDNLNSDSSTDVLSAKQGHVLKGMIEEGGGGTTTHPLKTYNGGLSPTKTFDGSSEVSIESDDILSSLQMDAINSGINAQTVDSFVALIQKVNSIHLTGDASGTINNTAIPVTVANYAISSTKLSDGAVTTIKLSNNAVVGQKIANNTITLNKLESGVTKCLVKKVVLSDIYSDVEDWAEHYQALILVDASDDISDIRYIYSGKDSRDNLLFTRSDGVNVYLYTLDNQNTWTLYSVEIGGGGGTIQSVSIKMNGNIIGTITGIGGTIDLGTVITDISGKADKASITAGTAGSTTTTSGASVSIPYVTMNAQGIVTGYGIRTHNVTGFLTAHQDISGKADKLSSSASGHIAQYNSSGNLADSGKTAYELQDVVHGYMQSTPNYRVTLTASRISGSSAHFFIRRMLNGHPTDTDSIVLSSVGEMSAPIPQIKSAMISASILETSNIVSESGTQIIFDVEGDAVYSFMDVPTSLMYTTSSRTRVADTLVFIDNSSATVTPSADKIYVDDDTEKLWRYDNNTSTFVLISDINGKADKLSSSASGHIAQYNSGGNLADSGKTINDFQVKKSDFDLTSTFNLSSGAIITDVDISALLTSIANGTDNMFIAKTFSIAGATYPIKVRVFADCTSGGVYLYHDSYGNAGSYSRNTIYIRYYAPNYKIEDKYSYEL